MSALEQRSYWAIAAVSCAVLVYEIAITRVLSVVLWYHFAFLSVSLALLGLGAPGIWFSRFRPGPRALPGSLFASGVTIPASIVVITKLVGRLHEGVVAGEGSDRLVDAASGFPLAQVMATIVAVLVPMLCLGSCVCLLLLRAEGRKIGIMYGADLLGATLGAALVVPLLHHVPTPALIGATGVLPLGAVGLLSRRARPVAIGLIVGLLLTIFQGDLYELRYTKKYREADRVLYEKWTPTGRIAVFPDVFHATDPSGAFAWGFGAGYDARPVEQLWLEQDGSAGTPITKWTGSAADHDHLFWDVTSVAYQIRPPGRVCVIGAGGGRDVLTALHAGASEVWAVELNPHILAAVSGPFAEYSGDLYRRPGVIPVAAEGRSFLTRTPHRFETIQVSMVDSWAATSAGAYSLSENFLYTVEAFRLYWDRLTDDGILSMSRWYLHRHLVEAARLVLLAQEALARAGVEEPRQHMAVVNAGAVATLLVSKRPFSRDDFRRIDTVCAERGFLRTWPPSEKTPRGEMIPQLLTQGAEVMGSTGLDLSPPVDDRPFFFQTVPVIGRVDRDLVDRLSVNEQSVILLRRLILVVVVLAVALFLLPFGLSPERKRRTGFWEGSGFFAAIGLAFLFVEISWIHRFILYLGHPSYATTVVLAAMLLGAGAGSLAASRMPERTVRAAGIALPIAALTISLLLGPVFRGTLGWPIAGRVAVSLLLLVPPSFLMGLPFPLGMVRFGEENKAWFWAMNGIFSVLASVTSLALSMVAGYAAVGHAGVAIYVVAVALYAGGGRRRGTRGGTPSYTAGAREAFGSE